MGQSIAIVIIIIFLAFMFVPMALLSNNQYQIGGIKQSLNLSAKVLINSVEVEVGNLEELSDGYNRGRQQEILVDKEKLLVDFYDVLYKNYYDEGHFQEIKDRLLLKVLVLNDGFYVANIEDQWSHPYFFLLNIGERNLYVDIRDDLAYYYDENGDRVYESLLTYGKTQEEKHQLIIDKINEVVAMETSDLGGEGLEIMIQNPNKKDGENGRQYSNFNVLEGITFFVIYREDSEIEVNRNHFQYMNYNVVGYTLGF